MHLHPVLAHVRVAPSCPLERLGALVSHTAGFAHEEILEDVEPAGHANDEANPCLQRTGLAGMAEGEHHISAASHERQ